MMKTKAILLVGLLFISGLFTETYAQRVVKKTTNTRVAKVSRAKVVHKKPKTKVVAVSKLPSTKRTITHNGINFYFVNNKYYRNYNGRYIIVKPRAGLRVPSLPVGYRRMDFGSQNYFLFNGVFYIQVDNEYEVVYPDVGTIVYELPDDYEKVDMDGVLLYESGHVLYEKIQVNGTRAYEVVGIIED